MAVGIKAGGCFTLATFFLAIGLLNLLTIFIMYCPKNRSARFVYFLLGKIGYLPVCVYTGVLFIDMCVTRGKWR